MMDNSVHVNELTGRRVAVSTLCARRLKHFG